MSKYDKEFEELIKEEEVLLEDIYNKKLAHLERELQFRLALGDKGFTVVEPKYDYENTPEHIEHAKDSLRLAVDEEKAKIRAALNNIERNRLQRKEMNELKSERDSKL